VATSVGMNELHVTLGDRSYSFAPGKTVRIGRSPDNDVIVGDPTVSRQHAQLSMGPDGWEYESVGRALSLLSGAPVLRATLSGPTEIQLASTHGPVLALTPGDAATPSPGTLDDADEPSTDDFSGDPAWAALAGEPGSPVGTVSPAEPDPVGTVSPAEPDPVGTVSPAEPDRQGQPEYPGEAGSPGEPADAGSPEAAGQLEGPGGSGDADQSGLAGEPAEAAGPEEDSQPDRTSVLESPAVPYGPGYTAGAGQQGAGQQGAGQPEGGAYPAGAGYPGGPDYAGGPGSTDGSGYPAGGYFRGDVPRIRPVAGQPVDEIATALHILVPVRSWLHDPGWRQFLRLLVIPYGLLPLVFIALFASSNSLSTPGWAYSLYIAPLWAIVFWLLIRPGQVRRQEALIAVAAVAFELLWIRLVTVHVNELMGKPGKSLPFLGALGVGVNEEITKALPILLAALLLLKLRSVKLDVRMWMFLGTIVGLAFGVTEQAGYTLQDIQAITSAQANSQAIVEVLAFAERVFVDGFQHAMWAGVSAFFIGIAVNYPRRRVQLIAFGIAVPAVLHGLYDWSAGAFASLWVPIIIQALSLFLFLGYTMSAAAIERQVRGTPMFRGESMLMERISDRD
jgi:RsiW-degrading membrane proteinase PrsW (M82 family)